MQDRHLNPKQYFKEQGIITEKYIIPYINKKFPINQDSVIMEIGCGVAGNMLPFVNMGCKTYGIDINKSAINEAKTHYYNNKNKKNITFIAEDIYNISADSIEKADVLIMHNTIEHIPNQKLFLAHIKQFLKSKAVIFFSFPPWKMPFGGHQQVCDSKILERLPYFHLLPKFLYIGILKLFGEKKNRIKALIETRETRISIENFKKIIAVNNYKILSEDFYLINPGYEIKFNLKPRKLPKILNIPHLRDFFITNCYYIISKY